MTTSENAIELEGVGKRYALGEQASAASAWGDLVKVFRRRAADEQQPETDAQAVWALRDVNLEVPAGTTLGIVGRNGAGKSTLLKILARITEPTLGVSRTRGSVGSLLEVGTGFHPELTGRENVFLNAAVLGIPRSLAARRFDDIVEFSGVSRFIDTPVKRYSSGMYLRLAFAVAAHVEADVLLVDEVLAVGDAEFQRRCVGKMEEIGRSGRTVVFISHNLDAVTRLCANTLWLDGGQVCAIGPTADVVDAYLLDATPDGGTRTFVDDPSAAVALRSVRVRGETNPTAGRIPHDDAVIIDVELVVREALRGLDLAVSVETIGGFRLIDEALSDSSTTGETVALARPGQYAISLALPAVLMPGEYSVNLWIGTPYETIVWEHGAARLRLEGSNQARPDRVLFSAGSWLVSRNAEAPLAPPGETST